MSHLTGVLCLTIFCCVNLPAQIEADRSIALPASPAAPPMTVGEKFRYRLRHSFDVERPGLIRAGGAIDELAVIPPAGDGGWDSYGVRVTSHYRSAPDQGADSCSGWRRSTMKLPDTCAPAAPAFEEPAQGCRKVYVYSSSEAAS